MQRCGEHSGLSDWQQYEGENSVTGEVIIFAKHQVALWLPFKAVRWTGHATRTKMMIQMNGRGK
jgi:hypothetical protein